MVWIDLGVPQPRDLPITYSPSSWDFLQCEKLSLPTEFSSVSLVDVLKLRRSRREFGAVDSNTLAKLLWLCSRVQESSGSEYGFLLSKRPAPSSGALHPVHVLTSRGEDSNLWLYDGFKHTLSSIIASDKVLAEIRQETNHLLPLGEGNLLLFAAEPGRSFAKYTDACSLVWRDAGILLGYYSLAAEALGLNFCALGITGEPWISKLSKNGQLVGVGVALVGSSY